MSSAAERGHLQCVQYLWGLKASHGVDTEADAGYALRGACMFGHLPTAQWVWARIVELGWEQVEVAQVAWTAAVSTVWFCQPATLRWAWQRFVEVEPDEAEQRVEARAVAEDLARHAPAETPAEQVDACASFLAGLRAASDGSWLLLLEELEALAAGAAAAGWEGAVEVQPLVAAAWRREVVKRRGGDEE